MTGCHAVEKKVVGTAIRVRGVIRRANIHAEPTKPKVTGNPKSRGAKQHTNIKIVISSTLNLTYSPIALKSLLLLLWNTSFRT